MNFFSHPTILDMALRAAGHRITSVSGPPWRLGFVPGTSLAEKQAAQAFADAFVFPTEEEAQRLENRRQAKAMLRDSSPDAVLRRAAYAAIAEQLNPGLTLPQILAGIESKIDAGVGD